MKNTILIQNNYLRFVLGTCALLLIPLVLTLTGSGVDGEGFHWTLGDFIVMGILIFGTGAAYEFISKRFDKKYRIYIALFLLGALFLIWAELAVDLVSQILSGEIWMRFPRY